MSFYVDGKHGIPTPSVGQPMASVPVLVALKLALYEAMLAQGVSNATLAKRAGTDEKAILRMLALFQATNVDNLKTVLGLLILVSRTLRDYGHFITKWGSAVTKYSRIAQGP